MKESELKSVIVDYLEICQRQGKLYWDRLNSGDFIEVRGPTRRRVKGCRKGTADLFILSDSRVIFLELKSEKGKQTETQKEFEMTMKLYGNEYYIVKSFEDLETILEGGKA
jgi:hypothetical protein